MTSKETKSAETLPVTDDIPRDSFVDVHDVAVGTFVGDYRITGELGSGTMGFVRHARDEKLERDVAIKFIRPEYLVVDSALTRFQEEARTMASVRHPNVVTVYSVGDHAGAPYFVMEYIAGSNLEQWLADNGALPVETDEGVGILREICKGVSAIHDVGAIHGDIKPSNVLVSVRGEIVVADLGLARFLRRDSTGERKASLTGTPAYMAPEILLMRGLEPELAVRADVYSLGVMAYELLTGQLPFQSAELVELLNMHATLPPPPPTSVSDLPPCFDDVLLRALSKDPALRTESIRAFREDLERALESARTTFANESIVVLDDDEDFAEFVRTTLEAALPGADLHVFHTPAKALEAIPLLRPSAVVTDLSMPDINGVEVLAAIKSSSEGRTIPVIVMTAVGGAKDWQVLEKLGADAFFPKPIRGPELVEAVRSAVSRRNLPFSLPPPSIKPGSDDD